jgi:fructokinase
VARLVASSDLAKASDEDLAWLYPNMSIEEAAATWLDLGAAAVLVTRAGNGARVFTSRERVDVAGVPVEVVDTIGAGDTFSAAVIDGLWSSGLVGAENRERLRDLASPQWRQIAEYAVLAAGIAVSRPGADPPRAHELPPKPSLEAVPHVT